ncbi:MAG: aminoglycoside phosphotransferase family protein [Myxococcota bacterium]
MAIENMEERVRAALSRLLNQNAAEQAELENLGGHASLRIYWRVSIPEGFVDVAPRNESTLMAMVLPQDEDAGKSEEGMSSEAAEADELPFVNVHRYLESIDVPVPAIDSYEEDLGVLLLEDLGDETLEEAILEAAGDLEEEPETRYAAVTELYEQVIDVLLDFQENVLRSKADPKYGEDEDCIAFDREFDKELLRWELDHYLEWGLEERVDDEDIAPYSDVIDEEFDRLVDELWDLLDMLVLRDFQSRNLMRKDGEWKVIDFQDALLGPFSYDLVALLRDSYIELDDQRVRELVDYYTTQGQQRGLPWCGDPDAVWRAFNLQTVQRKLKDAGRFVYIDRVKDNPDFLKYYDASIGYVEFALEQLPGWGDLLEALRAVEPSMSDEDH